MSEFQIHNNFITVGIIVEDIYFLNTNVPLQLFLPIPLSFFPCYPNTGVCSWKITSLEKLKFSVLIWATYWTRCAPNAQYFLKYPGKHTWQYCKKQQQSNQRKKQERDCIYTELVTCKAVRSASGAHFCRAAAAASNLYIILPHCSVQLNRQWAKSLISLLQKKIVAKNITSIQLPHEIHAMYQGTRDRGCHTLYRSPFSQICDWWYWAMWIKLTWLYYF